MGIHQWWGCALDENENPDGGHLTDDQLSNLFFATFPKKAKHQPVKRFRSWYNSGAYNSAGTAPEGRKDIPNGTHPAVKSINYSAKSNRPTTSTGKMAEIDSLHSSRREKLVEHLFVAEILCRLWCRGVHEV